MFVKLVEYKVKNFMRELNVFKDAMKNETFFVCFHTFCPSALLLKNFIHLSLKKIWLPTFNSKVTFFALYITSLYLLILP